MLVDFCVTRLMVIRNARDELTGLAAVTHCFEQDLARRKHVIHHRTDQGRDALHGLDLGHD